MAEERWWYCLKHRQVENNGCRNADRLGPFKTREEAENAIQIAADKTKEWDKREKEWEEGPSPDEE